jgi:hypothetical protein
MGQDITGILYFRGNPPAMDERLCAMVTAFSASPRGSGTWQQLKVTARGRATRTLVAGPAIPDAISAAFSGQRLDDARLSVQGSLRCRLVDPAAPPGEDGGVIVTLESWGAQWYLGQSRFYGEAGFWIYDVKPFFAGGMARSAKAKSPPPDVVNAVYENLEALSEMMFCFIQALSPASAKIFFNGSFPLPHNAHLAYYRDTQAVIDDVALIRDVWRHGLPWKHEPLDESSFFDERRTPEERERLRSAFQRFFDRGVLPTEAAVERVLAGGRIDFHRMPVGWTILEYPEFMSHFVDRFFTELFAAT